MNIPAGARATSKNCPAQAVRLTCDPGFLDTAYFEGCITNIFLPYLIDEIPEGAWQILQGKLNSIIHKILLTKKQGGNYESGRSRRNARGD